MERIQLTARTSLQGGEIPLDVIASNQQERECVSCQDIDEAMTKISGEILLMKRIVINFMKQFIHCIDLLLVFSLMKKPPFVFNLAMLLFYYCLWLRFRGRSPYSLYKSSS